MSDAVLYSVHERVALITLNRPDNRNSMTNEVLDGFTAAARRAAADRDLRAVVLTGSGKCFSAGADFKAQVQREDATAMKLPHERSFAMYEPFLEVLAIEVPVIAALNGHTVGGGFGLSLLCDLRLAARHGKYGANFCRLGIGPGMAITYTLPRVVGAQRAAELLYTGRMFEGDEAVEIGYALRSLPQDAVLPESLTLARAIALSAPQAVRQTKAMLRRALADDPRSHAAVESYTQAETLAMSDAREGIAALLEKRDPVFTGR
jgi:enoyl-CoA hydratase/carnithine racemase